MAKSEFHSRTIDTPQDNSKSNVDFENIVWKEKEVLGKAYFSSICWKLSVLKKCGKIDDNGFIVLPI